MRLPLEHGTRATGIQICAPACHYNVLLVQTITARKDRNNYYEAIKAHSAVVTCSLFAPVPHLVLELARPAAGRGAKEMQGEVVVSGDFDGDIKIFINQRNNPSL